MKKVVKFGGSSLASAEQFRKVGDIIRADEDRRYVVPSAPGKRFSKDIKVTDMLYQCYYSAANGEDFEGMLQQIQSRYNEIIGGLNLDEPAADLAMVMALASSFRDKPIPSDLVAIGEVGLTGELRAVNGLGQRLSEVRRIGFTKCLIPARNSGKLTEPEGLQLIRVRNIREALAAIL